MSLTTDAPLRPQESGFSPANRALLARFWHPVAFASEIAADRPYPFTLLDLPLVAFRTSEGVAVAFDRCPHRGSALSLGRVEGDRLVCGYHGLQFDAAGRCRAIPAAGPDARIPEKMRLRSFAAAERYGIVWTCLAEAPIQPLPEWPALEDPALQKVCMTPADWNASASRHVENFNDVAHFPWIHAGTFGNRDDPLTPRYQVTQTGTGLYRALKVKQIDRDSFAGTPDKVAEMDYAYDFTFPFSSYLKISSPDGRDEHIFDTIRPISACTSRVFILKARNYDLDQPVDDWIRFQEAVNAEDQAMVESQQPQEVPLDPAAEAHIEADLWSIAYRRRWKALGME